MWTQLLQGELRAVSCTAVVLAGATAAQAAEPVQAIVAAKITGPAKLMPPILPPPSSDATKQPVPFA